MSPEAMRVDAALGVLAAHRTDEIVVTTMGATREWSKLSNSAFDLHYLPSAMGQAPMIALGLAVARPEREVIAINGDGSLLMNLGCLVTIAAIRPRNLTMILLDNGVYEVTGGQATAGGCVRCDYAAMACGAGFPTAISHSDLSTWKNEVANLQHAPAPRFIALRVTRVSQDYVPKLALPIADRLRQFRAAIP